MNIPPLKQALRQRSMELNGTECKLMKLHVRSWNCVPSLGSGKGILGQLWVTLTLSNLGEPLNWQNSQLGTDRQTGLRLRLII